MSGYPPQYAQDMGGRYPAGRDPYAQSGAVTQQPTGGYYPTYPGPQQQPPQPKYEKQYDNRGYREDPRYYDAPPPAQRSQKPYKPQLPDNTPAGLNGREWSTGLFECTKDTKMCCCVLCCSPWYEMYRAHELGESCWNFSPCCLGNIGSTLVLRHRMRERENIKGSLMMDCLTTAFCAPCTTCQLFRENDIIRGAGSPDMGPQRPMDRY